MSKKHHDYDMMTEAELREHFNAIGQALKELLPERTGFILLAGAMNERGAAQFISNVRPEDSSKWMLETVYRWLEGDTISIRR